MDKKIQRQAIIALLAVCILILLVKPEAPPTDGWVRHDQHTRYLVNAQPLTGWQTLDGITYYFDAQGNLCRGWQHIDGRRYYLDETGALCSGWLEADGRRYYLDETGACLTGWKTVSGNRYHFAQDGAMTLGVLQQGSAAYLLGPEGLVRSDWLQLEGQTYYADEKGHPAFGWTEIDGTRHYFQEDGALASGWLFVGDFLHYFYTDGTPAQGELTIDGETFYFASNGQQLYFVNPWHALPEDYTVELVPIGGGHQIAAVAYRDYLDMMAACADAGLDPAVCSSYRTMEYQQELYENRIERYIKAGYSKEKARSLAGRSVAVPGTSEHQLGYALDIVDNSNWHLNESQEKTETQKWLIENSWRYGWILRYPDSKSHLTGIIYEPWHYRYVGKTVAQEIHELNVCLEEYLQMLSNSVG